MTYVLLFTNSYRQPDFIQGTLDEINKELRESAADGMLDTEYWDYSKDLQLLVIENDRLTQVKHYKCHNIPQFSVD